MDEIARIGHEPLPPYPAEETRLLDVFSSLFQVFRSILKKFSQLVAINPCLDWLQPQLLAASQAMRSLKVDTYLGETLSKQYRA